jgi:hypothetical protein
LVLHSGAGSTRKVALRWSERNFWLVSFPLRECIGTSANWLAEIQSTADGGWGQTKGDSSNSLNTAEAILGLLESEGREPGDKTIQDGVHYLINNQMISSGDLYSPGLGYWSRDLTKDHINIALPDVVRTALAVRAIARAGKPVTDRAVVAGLQWLLSIQNADGGWGYSEREESRLFPTCMVMKTLLRLLPIGQEVLALYPQSQQEKCLRDGLGYIRTKKNEDGSFGDSPMLLVPHTIHVIDLIHGSEASGWDSFPKIYHDLLKPAVRWVEDNRRDVLRWSTETVLLDGKKVGPIEYVFSHINPSLYLRYVFPIVLEITGGNRFDPQTALAHEALQVTLDNLEPSPGARGFCAKRPVSWATAQTIAALARATKSYSDFPERPNPSTKFNDRHYVLLFLVFLSFLTFILSLTDRLSGPLLSFFQFVILATLLIYGALSEKTLVSIIRGRLLFR